MKQRESEHVNLDLLFSQCFEGGQRLRRELRLTPAQAEYLSVFYPATLCPMGDGWYDVALEGAMSPQ